VGGVLLTFPLFALLPARACCALFEKLRKARNTSKRKIKKFSVDYGLKSRISLKSAARRAPDRATRPVGVEGARCAHTPVSELAKTRMLFGHRCPNDPGLRFSSDTGVEVPIGYRLGADLVPVLRVIETTYVSMKK
jgi:hypothetical protein